MKNRFSYFLLLSVVMLLFVSCDKDDDTSDKIVGTWQLTKMEVDGQQQDISDTTDILQFQSNSLFVRFIVSTSQKIRGGWSYEGDMLNISPDLPAAYYVVSANGSELILKRIDFNTDGSLKTTIISYQKVADEMIP